MHLLLLVQGNRLDHGFIRGENGAVSIPRTTRLAMATTETSETAIFERIVLPNDPDLSEQAARSILAMGFSAEDRERMQQLADKAKAGQLSLEEQQEIDNYERVGHYLSILQSKARLALKGATDSNS